MNVEHTRMDAREVLLRDTEYGPEIVLDHGVQGSVLPCTDADLAKLVALVMAREGFALECAWCGCKAVLDGCTQCDCTAVRRVAA